MDDQSISTPSDVVDQQTETVPVVFVHGNGESAQAWDQVAGRFRQCGYNQLFAISLDPPSHGSCVAYAAQLAEFINTEVRPKVGAQTPIAIIAHSLGAPVVRYYLSFLGGARLTSHAVLIAGCNAGAPACDVMLLRDPEGKIFRQAREVHTGGSEFLRNLDARGIDDGVRYMTISGPHDVQFSLFEESAQLAGADNRVLPRLGHWGVRSSDESFELMRAFLENRADQLPGGQQPLNIPDDLTGIWLACDPGSRFLEFDFRHDGTFAVRTGETESSGTYNVSVSPPTHRLDLQLDGARLQGLYRLTVEGDTLALALGSPEEPRPEHMRSRSLFRRKGAMQRPEALVGKWRSTFPGGLRGIGIGEFSLDLRADGQWSMTAAVPDAPDLELSGVWSADPAPDGKAGGAFSLDLEIDRSNARTLESGAWWGGLLAVEGDSMALELPPVTRAACRPQLIDYPAMLVRM
ncbi:MAG: hypothetical protein Q8L23_10980 [Caulobacter sp.]|nr:hypothetical protein [Caulobacter sp.]